MFYFTCTKFWPTVASKLCAVPVVSYNRLLLQGLSTRSSLTTAAGQVHGMKKRIQRRKPVAVAEDGRGVRILRTSLFS